MKKIQVVVNNEDGIPVQIDRWEVSGEPSRVGITANGKHYSLVLPKNGPPSIEIWTADEEGPKEQVLSTVLI